MGARPCKITKFSGDYRIQQLNKEALQLIRSKKVNQGRITTVGMFESTKNLYKENQRLIKWLKS